MIQVGCGCEQVTAAPAAAPPKLFVVTDDGARVPVQTTPKLVPHALAVLHELQMEEVRDAYGGQT